MDLFISPTMTSFICGAKECRICVFIALIMPLSSSIPKFLEKDLKMAISSNAITFHVKSATDDGTKYSFHLPKSTAILKVKNLLAHQAGIPTDQQRLIYMGLLLGDAETLGFASVRADCTILLVHPPLDDCNEAVDVLDIGGFRLDRFLCAYRNSPSSWL